MKSEKIYLVVLLSTAAIFRFYNLLHDSPHFFNPDERNMAIAITRFVMPSKLSQIPLCTLKEFFPSKLKTTSNNLQTNECSLNPHFFAYGQFPLYLAFASDQIKSVMLNLIQHPLRLPLRDDIITLTTDFSSAVFWLRFWSAISSVLTVLFVYLISRQLLSADYSLMTAAFAAFSPGLIQAAHFGTTESVLTFFFLTTIYFSMKLSRNLSKIKSSKRSRLWKNIILISLSIGLSLGSKLTGIFFLVPPITVFIFAIINSLKGKRRSFFNALRLVFLGTTTVLLILLFFFVSSPYNLVAPDKFKSAVFGYESDVATGKYEAFYTRQFINTVPFLFQAGKIFPYTLGWPVFILGSLGLLFMHFQIFLKYLLTLSSKIQFLKLKFQIKKASYHLELKNLDLYWILIIGFWIYFVPNTILFAKWTRFMTPVFPLIAIFAGYLIQSILSRNKNLNKISLLFVICFLLSAILPGLAFLSVYARPDTRVAASRWIYKNIPDKSYILSETANVIDIPLSLPDYRLSTANLPAGQAGYSLNVISFDFYHLDENPQLFSNLLSHLENAGYIFIPSRRIFKNHPRQPQKYKLVTKYYQLLFSGSLGFEKVAEFSSFPTLSLFSYHLSLPDEDAEETFTVFDHPVIRIYKKVKSFAVKDYQYLFNT